MKDKLRAAVVQAGSKLFDLDATLERFEQHAIEAARQKAEIAVFPEAFIGGYPKGMDFGVTVGQRTEAGREWFARYYRDAIDVPGPVTDRLGEIARGCNLAVVVGAIERDGGTLYCTALYIGAHGRLLGKHRKLMPTAMERVIWGCGDGSTLSVVDAGCARVGAAICWENYMPQARMALYEQNVELYCAPTVDDRETWQPSMRHIAVEGRCFVLSACQYLTREDCPEDYPVDFERFPDHALIRGGSTIVDPFGEVLAGPVYGEEKVLVAELEARRRIEGRFDLDVAGHYARRDLFGESVLVGGRIRSGAVGPNSGD